MHSQRPYRLNLRQLILLLAVTSGALMLAAGMLGAYEVQRQQLIDATLASNEAFAQKLATTTADMLDRAQRDLAYSAAILERSNLGPGVMRAELDRLREQGIGFNSVTLVSRNGIIQLASPQDLGLAGKRTNSEAAQEALRLWIPFVSQPFTTVLGNLAIAVSHPLFNAQHQYLGYLMGVLYLKTNGGLYRLMGEQFFHDGTYVYVVDSSRRLLYHPGSSQIGTTLEANPAIDAALDGSSGQTRFTDSAGDDMLTGYAYVRAAQWGIIVQRPTSMALRHMNDLMWRVLWLTLGPAILLLALLWFSSRWISRPLEQLARIVRDGYEAGQEQRIAAVQTRYYEADQLKHALMDSLGSVRTQLGKLHDEAHTDPLTGLGNRRGLSALLEFWQALAEPFAVISLDIDFFKTINDTYGHDAGDEVIRGVGIWMRSQARQGDVLFRTGGEEFLALLPGVDLDQATSIAQRLCVHIAEADILSQQRVTVSIGVSAWISGNVHDVLKAADRALYQAKQQGRNQVVIASMDDTAVQ
ncbi:MAG TPA: sensor domain-containing diguanylate cyclase [Castellaniella sp.]|uniref:GGDEF domain-containing protein n=1 Tax=Castellaniella sp. TaxID=1955812 RepID=UPI002F0D3726